MYPYIQNGVPNYGLGANQGSPLYYQSESPHPEGHPLYKKEGYYTLGPNGVRKYVSGPTNTKNVDVDQKAPDLSTAHLTGGSSTYVPGRALPRFPGVYGGPFISTNPFGSVPQSAPTGSMTGKGGPRVIAQNPSASPGKGAMLDPQQTQPAPANTTDPAMIAGNQPMIYPWIPRGIPKLEETQSG